MSSFIIVLLAGSVLSVDGSFLFIFISILLLIFLLNRTLFAPINAVLDERERLGAGRLRESQRLLKQYETRLQEYENKLQAARADAYQTLEMQRKEAQTMREEMLAQVKQETAAQVNRAKGEIRQQVESARKNLETEARAMAGTISSQLLNRPVR